MPLEEDWPDDIFHWHECSVPVQQVCRSSHNDTSHGGSSQLLLKSLPSSSDIPSAFTQGEKRKLVGSIRESSTPAPPSKKARFDVKVLLNDLKSTIKTLLEDFQNHSHIAKVSWFHHLKVQCRFIDEIKESTDASSLLDNPALAFPYFPPDLPLSLVESHHRSRVKLDLQRIEALRQDILFRATNHIADAPPAHGICLPFPEIIFLSMAFYHYALLRSYAPGCFMKSENNEEFMNARQAARRLFIHASTPEFFQESQRIDNFLKILIDFLPNDDAHRWVMEAVTPFERKEILVYRRYEGNHPLVLATAATLDAEEDETPFSDIIRKYSHINEEDASGATLSKSGIPVLFIQLTDSYFLVGGVVGEQISGLPLVQRLPGHVDLTEDFGYNLYEAAYTIWTLGKSLGILDKETTVMRHAAEPYSSTKGPSVGLEGGGISIIASPYPGILYRVKLDFTKPVGRPGIEGKDHLATLKMQGLAKKPANTSYIMKVTYPYKSRAYGTVVHQLLDRHGFAPVLYLEFSPTFELSHYELEGYDPLICYHLMQYLAPPTKTDSGWVTLDEFAETVKADALIYKGGIQRSLDRIIALLQANGMVHGDMRPNNIMIRVRIRKGVMCPEFREDLNLIDLRVIDFDWAGEAGNVFYPPVRNSFIKYWPGQDGGPILAAHDEDMVRAWMKTWPDYA